MCLEGSGEKKWKHKVFSGGKAEINQEEWEY